MPYFKTGDPAGAALGETALRIRPCVIDGNVEEWTTGVIHNLTTAVSSYVPVMRLNDSLPLDKPKEKSLHPASAWVWQLGPGFSLTASAANLTALKLPD